jgi:Zn-dependent protease
MDAASDERTQGFRGIPLFTISGIRVRLDPSWFLIFLLILVSLSLGYFPRAHPEATAAEYWTVGAVATLLFFLSILVHELAHALVAQRAGIRVPAITLFLFGGVSHMEEEATTPRTDFRVAAVGPLASFALAGLFWAGHRALPAGVPPLASSVVLYLAWINAALGVFNLLPGLPLDGGRLLRAAAWWKTGSLRRATRLAADAGKGLAIGIVLLGAFQLFSGALLGGVWLILIGMFMRSLAEASYQNLVLVQALEDVRVADVAVEDPVTVPRQLSLRALVDDYLLQRGFHAYPVLDGDRPVGLISLEDLRGVPVEKRESTTVGERMRPLDDALRVEPDLPLREALRRLGAAPGGRLLVLRGGELRGLLTKSALLRFVQTRNALQEG